MTKNNAMLLTMMTRAGWVSDENLMHVWEASMILLMLPACFLPPSYFATLLHCYFTTLLLCYLATLILCYSATLLHCYFATLLLCCFAILLLCCIAALLLCCFATFANITTLLPFATLATTYYFSYCFRGSSIAIL